MIGWYDFLWVFSYPIKIWSLFSLRLAEAILVQHRISPPSTIYLSPCGAHHSFTLGGGRFSFLKIKGIRACLLFSPAWQPISSTLPTRSQILHTPFQFLPKSLLKSAEFLLDPVLWGWPGRLENISGKYVPNLERPKRATVKAQRRLTLWLSQLSRRNPWCGMTLHSARMWCIFCLVCCSTFGDGEFSGGKCEFKRRWHTHANMCQNISRVPGKKEKKKKGKYFGLVSNIFEASLIKCVLKYTRWSQTYGPKAENVEKRMRKQSWLT